MKGLQITRAQTTIDRVLILYIFTIVAPSASSCSPFPTPTKIQQIIDLPSPSAHEMFGERPALVDRWSIAAELPYTIGERGYEGHNPTSRIAITTLSNDPDERRLTGGMTCYAQELGRFWLQHRGGMPHDIDLFVRARCAVATARTYEHFLHIALEPDDDPERFLGDIHLISKMVTDTPKGSLLGVWGGSDQSSAVIAMVVGTPQLDIEPASMIAQKITGQQESTVRFVVSPRKKLNRAIDTLEGYTTKGPRGYNKCRSKLEGSKKNKKYLFECPVDETSYYTLVELVATEQKRILGQTTFSAMFATKRDYLLPFYEAPRIADSTTSDDRFDTISYARHLNDLRSQDKLNPLDIDTDQSSIISRLLPHYLAGQRAGDYALVDDVALSMMAGWGISGLIRSADLSSSYQHSQWTFRRAFEAAKLSPLHRAVVFDPDNRSAGLGVLDNKNYQARASVVVGFSFFNKSNYRREEELLVEVLDKRRKRRRLPPVRRVADADLVKTLQEAASNIREGKTTPSIQSGDLPVHFEFRTGYEYEPWVTLTSSLDPWMFEFPPELVNRYANVEVGLFVTHYRPQGLPWGSYVVFLLFSPRIETWL